MGMTGRTLCTSVYISTINDYYMSELNISYARIAGSADVIEPESAVSSLTGLSYICVTWYVSNH